MSDNKNYVRCWTCKSNGVDIFFGGVEERQVHEHSMHASLYQKGNSYTRNTILIELILDSSGYFLKGYRKLLKYIFYVFWKTAENLFHCILMFPIKAMHVSSSSIEIYI